MGDTIGKPVRQRRRRFGARASIVALMALLPSLFPLLSASAVPEELTFTPVADASVDAGSPATPFGDAPVLEVDGSPTKQTFLRFSVSGVSGAVTGVRLRLRVVNPSPSGGTVRSMGDIGWNEPTVTWDSRPAIDGPVLADLGGVTADTWTEVSLGTPLSGDGLASFGIASTHSNGADYASRESAAQPQLIVSYQSDPGPDPSPTGSPTPDPTPTQQPPAPTTLSFTPVADTFADASLPTTTFGGAAAVEVDGSPQREPFLRFSVSGVGGGTVQAVRLRLFNTNASPAGGNVRSVADTSWGEGTLTWNNRPGMGPILGSFGAVSAGNWFEVDLGSPVTADGLVSFGLRSSHNNGADYASRESVNDPVLEVDVTPEPTPEPTPSESPTPDPTPTESPTADPTPTTPPVAETLRFNPVADTSVKFSEPTTNFGGKLDGVEVDADPLQQSFLRFDIQGIGPDRAVTGVRLRLYNVNPSSQGGRVFGVSDVGWGEFTMTWNSKPTIDGPLLGEFGQVIRNTWQERALTGAVAGDGLISFAMDSNNTDGADFGSRESGTPPVLLVDVAPHGTDPSPTPSDPPPAGSETLVFHPTADASVKISEPTTNFGSKVDGVEVDADPLQQTFLRFDISGIGPDRVVTDVRLRLYTVNPSAQGGRIFWITDTSWSELGVTWNDKPAIDGELLTTMWGVTRNAWAERSLGIAVTADGILSLAMDSDNTDGADYGSRESSTPPTLLIDVEPAGPEPTSEPEIDPVIAAAGDIACDPLVPSFNGGNGTPTDCRQMATSDILVAGNYAAVLPLGDLQYEIATLENFDASYDPSWGRVKAITYPAPGNHEYYDPNAAGYFAYFGTAAGDPAKGYYSFDVGDWHLVVLNSNCGHVSCSIGSAQETWLRADLAASTAQCTLATWHHPVFSSAEHGGSSATSALWQALYDYDAELILNGHHHNYERFAPMAPSGALDLTRGIRQFIVGTGGESFEDPGTMHPNSEAFNLTTFGVLELTLRSNSYEWSYEPIAGQTYRDSGSASCH